MQICTWIYDASDAMACSCQFGVFHPFAACLLYSLHNGAGALHWHHVIFVAMEDPERGVLQNLRIFDIATAAERDAGGKDTWILGAEESRP